MLLNLNIVPEECNAKVYLLASRIFGESVANMVVRVILIW